jgi:hypothetical protein
MKTKTSWKYRYNPATEENYRIKAVMVLTPTGWEWKRGSEDHKTYEVVARLGR